MLKLVHEPSQGQCYLGLMASIAQESDGQSKQLQSKQLSKFKLGE